MKKIIKKVLAMLLVICMALPTFVMTVSAEEGENTTAKIKWSYDPTTKVLTYTNNGASQITSDGIKSAGHSTEIVEVIVKNGTSKFTTFATSAFQSMSSLKKVTFPASVVTSTTKDGVPNGLQLFNQASALKELVVEGNAYIPGAVDFSNIKAAILSIDNHRTFETAKIETLILKGGVYSAETPIKTYPKPDHWAKNNKSLGEALKTIMGPADSEYLRDFCAANGYTFVPYGKIGEGTAWTYDEDAKTITIYGNGTSSTLTALSAADTAIDATILENATKVVIRADITVIEENALACLNALTAVEFLGNAPETTGNPFGEKTGITIYTVPGAKGFDDTWLGYTVSYPSATGTFVASESGTEEDGAWNFDSKTKTLHIWSNNSAKSISLSNLVATETFITFAKGDYSKYVTTVKFSQIDVDTNFVKTIDGGNNGFGQFADLGLTEIEEIYFFGGVLRKMEAMFNGLDKLTTFGNTETEEQTGTVNLVPYIMDGGDATDSFSGQTGIKKVILPQNNTWGASYSTTSHNGNHWANIPEGYFKNMTGLCEVVLNADTTSVNKADNANVNDRPAYFLGTCMIGANAFDGCTSLKSLTIPAGAPATAIFRRSNNTNEHTVKLFNENTFAGSSIETVYICNPDAAVVEKYNIPDVVDNIICTNDAVAAILDKNTTANVSGFLTGVGVAVRYKDYNGLRNIYSFNNVANANISGYTLVEYGAMIVSSKNLGESELTIDPSTLEANVDGAVKRAIWSNNAWAGKVLSHNENGETQFALTLRDIPEANYDDGVYSRAYAVYEDGNGNSFVAYADNGKAISLYDAMVYAGQNGYLEKNDKGEEIVCEDVAVWDVLATGKVEDLTVTGATAMVIHGKDASADTKVLVVRGADGTVADEATIDAAKNAATVAGYAVDSAVIALAFKPATEA